MIPALVYRFPSFLHLRGNEFNILHLILRGKDLPGPLQIQHLVHRGLFRLRLTMATLRQAPLLDNVVSPPTVCSLFVSDVELFNQENPSNAKARSSMMRVFKMAPATTYYSSILWGNRGDLLFILHQPLHGICPPTTQSQSTEVSLLSSPLSSSFR